MQLRMSLMRFSIEVNDSKDQRTSCNSSRAVQRPSSAPDLRAGYEPQTISSVLCSRCVVLRESEGREVGVDRDSLGSFAGNDGASRHLAKGTVTVSGPSTYQRGLTKYKMKLK